MRRRAAVEPVIGHIKAEHRMGRNYHKGRDGDRINAVLAAAGYNFGLLLRWIKRLETSKNRVFGPVRGEYWVFSDRPIEAMKVRAGPGREAFSWLRSTPPEPSARLTAAYYR